MGRPKKEHQPTIFQRNGRYYGDFRAYADVGGGREALAEEGSTWGTTDEAIAQALFSRRLSELEDKRRGRVGAKRDRRSIELAVLVRDHLKKKARAGKVTDSHLADLESRLRVAIKFFGADRDPRTIEPGDVSNWAEDLAKGDRRGPGTVRHYLNALSGLYGRAQEGLYVDPGYNPVSLLQEKPTGRWRGEADFFEVADGALILEAARVIEMHAAETVGVEGNRVNATAGLYPIIATFLLTGGRRSEVLGLEVEDVSFDRGVVRFRENAHRGLKTLPSHRQVPLWPQLREILQQWVFGGKRPRTSGLLFPAPHGGMVRDLRKSLDAIGELAGFDPGELRKTKRFRHTYCSARLQTVQRIVKPGRDPATDPDPYEYVEVSKFVVQKEMGHGGAQMVDRIYGHAQRSPHRSEVVEYRIKNHLPQLGARLARVKAFTG